MASLNLLLDWTQHLPCDDDFNVPLFCRPTFKDFTTFEMATRLGRLAADPTNYTDKEGGLYYRTGNQRLYYRNATVWVPLGLGDGDVIFDPLGTAQQDNGVARWSDTGKYIQGSLATLNDVGDFSTPGTYISLTNTVGHRAFTAQRVAGTPDFVIGNDGTLVWSNDTFVVRNSAQNLELQGTDARWLLSGTGNTRFQSRKYLGGLGDNTSEGNNFRGVVLHKTYGFYQTLAKAPGVALAQYNTTFYTYTIPANALATDGDSCEWTIQYQTLSSVFVKRVFIIHNAQQAFAVLPGSNVITGIVTIRILRQSANQAVMNIVIATDAGSTTSPSGQIYRADIDWTTTNDIDLVISQIEDGSTAFVNGDFIQNGARIVYHCQ